MNPLEEGNGPIILYTIRKTYSLSKCTNGQTSNMTTDKRNSSTADISLQPLLPYWNYNLSISASTKAGEGPPFALGIFRTNQTGK